MSKILVSCYTCYWNPLTNLQAWDINKADEARQLAEWLVKHNGHAILAWWE